MNENVKSMDRYKIKKVTGYFIKVPFLLLDYWSPWIENQCKGATLAYIHLQRFINRDKNNSLFGYAYPTYKELKKRMAIKSDKKIWKIMNFLVSINFIDRVKIGRKYYFKINPVPEVSEEVIAFHDDCKKRLIIERQKKEERFKALREKLTDKMPVDEDFIFGRKITEKKA